MKEEKKLQRNILYRRKEGGMSMYNGSADTTIPALILYIGIIGFLVIDFIVRHKPYKVRKAHLTRRKIIYMIWGAEVLRLIMMAGLLFLPITMAFLHGRIKFGGWIGSISTLLFFTAALLCSQLWYRWPAIQALYGKRRIPLPENVYMENLDGTWFYQDEKWYVHINNGYSLLYAPQIDFEVPVQYESRYGIKGGQCLYLRFVGLDGTFRYATHGFDDRIEKWVKAHKGSFFHKPVPKKPYRHKRK